MKFLKLGIHFWITLTSIFSFLTGWVLLAHAPKPDQSGSLGSGSAAPLPTLEPLNPLPQFQSDDDNFQNQGPFLNVGPRNQTRPFFRTGGS